MVDRAVIVDVDGLRQALLAEDGLRDLATCLDDVPREVNLVWQENYMPWFTDHGPGHSRRTAEYALRLADLPLLHPGQRLTALESLVLWAAAWLHDVGMQDLLATGQPLGEMDSDAYGMLRHKHPDRSSERILEDANALGLPAEDAALSEAVAAVARAHGTSYYRETVDERLQPVALVRNQPVRERLLAALLLFADELDLHYERAVSRARWAVDNPVSEAHKFKHQSVRAVRPVCSADGLIAVELELAFRPELPPEDALAVQRWIEVKLRRQMSMVEPEVVAGFSGQARFDRHIRTRVTTLRAHRPAPTAGAMGLIRAETARDELVNHRREFDEVRASLLAGAVVLLRPQDPTGGSSTDQASLDLVAAACAVVEVKGWTVALSRRPALSLGATASDVLGEWVVALGGEEPGATGDEGRRRSQALAQLVQTIRAASDQPFVLAVVHSDGLEDDALGWLSSTAAVALRAAGKVAILVAGSNAAKFDVPGDSGVVIHLGAPERAEVEEYLGRVVDRQVAIAESQSLGSYAIIKKTAQAHELQLQLRGGA